jgi:D-3-phosphoglycerate dehydrogenase / 2-oxoglutarate reductase
VTGPDQLRAVVVGDALLPTDLIVSEVERLGQHILIVDALDWGPPGEAELDQMALRVERNGPEAEAPPVELQRGLADADLLIVHYCPVSRGLLDAAPRLKILATCRAGTENLAAEYAIARGILVLHVVGRTTEAVSDFAIGLLLAEARNIARAHRRLLDGVWDKSFSNSAFTPELEGRTVGVVGFGEVGSAVARKLSGFRVRLLAFDPFVSDEAIRWGGADPTALPVLLEQSDFVTLHARPEPGAPPLLGREEFARMKPTAFLINTARAALVDTKALSDALGDGEIAGAALDVHDREPLGLHHPLLALDNVTLTPHLASSTQDCMEKSPRILVEDLGRVFAGDEPQYALNPELFQTGWKPFGRTS